VTASILKELPWRARSYCVRVNSRSVWTDETLPAGMLESLAAVVVAKKVVALGGDGRADGWVTLQGDGGGEGGAADAVLRR
jgi:hypothetical protein